MLANVGEKLKPGQSLALGVIGIFVAWLCFAGTPSANADPANSLDVVSTSSYKWTAPGSAQSFGRDNNKNGIAGMGDLNGDGTADVAVHALSGLWVLYTPPSLTGQRALGGDLPPTAGYRVAVAGDSPGVITNVGDQNGDGLNDMAFEANNVVYVVYGIADPTDLPLCDSATTTRCLTMSAASPSSQGYGLMSSTAGNKLGTDIGNAGDVNGDGMTDIAVGDTNVGSGTGAGYVVYGGRDSSGAVDIDTLPADEAVKMNGTQGGGFFGSGISGVGDVNGDGFDDVFVDEPAFSGANPAQGYLLYGGNSLPSPIDPGNIGDSVPGFKLQQPVLTLVSASPAGDINGDDVDDILFGGYGLTNTVGFGSIVYGGSAPATPFSLSAPPDGSGYTIDPVDANGSFGVPQEAAGDLNGDGVPDQMFGAPSLPINSLNRAGSAYFVFGQGQSPLSPLQLGPETTPSRGIALVGNVANQRAGSGVARAGDLDGDDIPDYFVANPGASVNGSVDGVLGVVLGSSLVPVSKTGAAGGFSDHGATVAGAVGETHGEGSAHFEYGPTDEYGQTTPSETANGTTSMTADIDGLQAKTEYHYRLVAVNAAGLTRYGQDRTFTTAAKPVDPCVADPTGPGCAEEPGTEFCKRHPADPVCQPYPTEPGLSSLIANSQAAKVRRGKKTTIWAWITSTGTKSADGVKVCASAPKSKAKVVGKSCRTIASLAPGKTAKVKFKVKAKARKGAKVKVKLTASAQGVSQKTAKVRLTVR